MPKLLVRQWIEGSSLVIVNEYRNIPIEEILLRFSCDYWVKGQRVFQMAGRAMEGDTAIIDVEEDVDEKVNQPGLVFAPTWEGVRIEVRHYMEDVEEYPLIDRMQFADPRQAMAIFWSDRILLQDRRWVKTSTEVDENRKVYVLYVQPENDEGDLKE